MLIKKKYNYTDETWHLVANNENVWIKWRFEVINKFLKELSIDLRKKKMCVDVGSGHGNFAKKLESISHFKIDQFDVINNSNLRDKTRGKFYLHDINKKNKKFKNKYDILFLLDVLEHIKNPQIFLNACKYYLKKDGILIINVPAVPALFSDYDNAVGHLRRYNKKSISRLLYKSKFKIMKITYWGLLLLPVLFIRTMGLLIFKPSKRNIIKKGMNTKNTLVRFIMEILFFLEFYIFKFGFYGTSLLTIIKRK